MSRKKKNRTFRPAEAATSEPHPKMVLSWRLRITFICVALLGAVADISCKQAVFSMHSARIRQIEGVPCILPAEDAPRVKEETKIVGETLKFQVAVNTGAVFGLFQGKWIFLIVFTIVALGIMGWVLFKSGASGKIMIAGLGLVCAGALGNLWDRLVYNGVRDFIVFTSPLLEPFLEGGRWPTFNLADVWICVGVPLILLGDYLVSRSAAMETKRPEESPSRA